MPGIQQDGEDDIWYETGTGTLQSYNQTKILPYSQNLSAERCLLSKEYPKLVVVSTS